MSENEKRVPPVCLTIAGLDPSGGAGVVADVKTFTAFGCYAAMAVTSLTYQNTKGVFGAEHQIAAVMRGQLEPVFDDLDVAAAKTGMLPTREVIEEVARVIAERELAHLVVDPVVRSTSGFDLIDDAALKALIEKLFPLALIVTPNLPEAERISGIAIDTIDDVHAAAAQMRSFGAKNVVIKGGHFDRENRERDGGQAVDHLFIGDEYFAVAGPFHDTTSTHGTGCTFAAAITANLALGKELKESVEVAKRFVNEGIRTAPKIGQGNSPVRIPPIWRPE